MPRVETHYPSYDIMALQDEWDSNTKEIVKKRLGPFSKPKFLKEKEVTLLAKISEHLTFDNRDEIIQWIIHHADQKLQTVIGEGEKKPEAPAEKVLVRKGLEAIDKLAETKYGKEFLKIDTKEQFGILAALQLGKADQLPEWSIIPQKELFNKLAEIAISAYYSHPTVWSEIGYGGPAYPRGYYRIEFGLADPWEAKKEGSLPSGFGEEEKRNGE
ncbi:MAG: gluconate 2-dehydrogenase subunit 3 family protein [Bacillota bacterium]|nr:gluconate 2-dehydrogenase subunit 3 family protein [Bacillota bacterium]